MKQNKTITSKTQKSLDALAVDNVEIFERYDIMGKMLKYSTVQPTKRGGARSSASDAKIAYLNAKTDKYFKNNHSLLLSWCVAISIFDGCCYICDERLYDDLGDVVENVQIQADHIIAGSVGGSINAGNMIAVHKNCNNLKSNMTVEEFLKNKPETLRKLHDFQALFNYKIDLVDFEEKRKKWGAQFDKIMNDD